MSRTPSGSEWLSVAQAKVVEETSVHEMRLAQSMLLPLLGLSLAETAQAMGQSVPTVSRLRRDFIALQGGTPLPRSQWGGRRHAYWLPEEEQAFLQPFLEEAEKGGILVVPPLHRALEEKLGWRYLRRPCIGCFIVTDGGRSLPTSDISRETRSASGTAGTSRPTWDSCPGIALERREERAPGDL